MNEDQEIPDIMVRVRLVQFLGSLVMVALAVISAFIILGGGYWLSDRVYDLGLWPVGAVMRIFLLMILLGYVGGVTMLLLGVVTQVPMLLFGVVTQLFRSDDNDIAVKELDDEHYSLVARMLMFRVLFAERIWKIADAEDVVTDNPRFDPMPLLEEAYYCSTRSRPARKDYQSLHCELVRYVRLRVQPSRGSVDADIAEDARLLLEAQAAVGSCLAALGREKVERLFGRRLAGLAGHVFEVEELLSFLDEKDLDPRRLGTLLADYKTPVTCDRCGGQETYDVPLSAAGGSTEEANRIARYWHDRQCPMGKEPIQPPQSLVG